MLARCRVKLWLPEADRRIAQARAFTRSGHFGFWMNGWRRFKNDMNHAARLYRLAELGLLARRIRATRDKCCRAWRLHPDLMQKHFDSAWQKFDELNAKDHFVYSTKQAGKERP